MPLLLFAEQQQPIEIDLPDLVLGETRICRRARFVKLEQAKSPAGEFSLVMQTEVRLHEATADGAGSLIERMGFSTYPVLLRGNNETVVAFPSGEILAYRTTHTPEEWAAVVARYAADQTLDTMLQGDWFEWLAEHNPPSQPALIRLHMQQAMLMGRYA
ncbi:hypothetical protein [Hymenobacter chitinivorans]|uniref:Uncharacterized protein n=1 Tax=Hymenobacter chitinivorans DSM 11115 TaxID=1121954 RepID=A0A2M9BN97_9BACT|nr:hypothetical protein [Hymenobacter chitinivorans]PJJ59427.1 hypothetical protein CLV45_0844 [Hymenobacter chitinivorans DSM 11115]